MPAEPRRLENHHFGSVFRDLHEKSGTAHKTLLERHGLEHNIGNLVRFYAEKRPKFFAFYVKKLVELKERDPLVNLILHFRTGNQEQRKIALDTFKSVLAHDKVLAREILERINDVNSKHYLPEPRPERREPERVEPERKPPVGPREPPAPARARERMEEPGSRRKREIDELLEPQPGEVEVDIDEEGRVRRKAPAREGPQELELDAEGNLRYKGPARQRKERSPIQTIPPEVLRRIRPEEYEQLYGKGKKGPEAKREEPERRRVREQPRQEEYEYENEIINGEIVKVPRLKQGPGELHNAAKDVFEGIGLLEIFGPQTEEAKAKLQREREETREIRDVEVMQKRARDIYSRIKTIEKRMYQELEELVLDFEGPEEGKKRLKKIAQEHKNLSLTNRLAEVNSLIIKLKARIKKEREGPKEFGDIKRQERDRDQDFDEDWFLKPDKDGVVRMPDLKEEPGVDGPEEKKQPEEKKTGPAPPVEVQENRSKRIERKIGFLSRHMKTKALEKKFNEAGPGELEALESEVNKAIDQVSEGLDSKLKDYLAQQHYTGQNPNKAEYMYSNIMKQVNKKMTPFERVQELERVLLLAEKGKKPLKEKRVERIEEFVDALLELGIYDGKDKKELEGIKKKLRRTVPGFRFSERDVVNLYNNLKADVGELERKYSDQIEENLAGADKDHPLRAHFENTKKSRFLGQRLHELKDLVEATKDLEEKDRTKKEDLEKKEFEKKELDAKEQQRRADITSIVDLNYKALDFFDKHGLTLPIKGSVLKKELVLEELEKSGFKGDVVDAHYNIIGTLNLALLTEIAKLRPTVFVREGVTDNAFLRELGIPVSEGKSYMSTDSLPKLMEYYERLQEGLKPGKMKNLADEDLYGLNIEVLSKEQAAEYAEQLDKRMPDYYPLIDKRDPWNTPERVAAMEESNGFHTAMEKKLKRAREIAGIKKEEKGKGPKKEEVKAEAPKEEKRPLDPSNPYGIPEADLKRVKDIIKALNSLGSRESFNEKQNLKGQIGELVAASADEWVKGVKSSKYLTPEQKEQVLKNGINENLYFVTEDLEHIKESPAHLSRDHIFEGAYNALEGIIRNVPELLEPYKARMRQLFAELEKVRAEKKITWSDDKIRVIREFLGHKELEAGKKGPEPPKDDKKQIRPKLPEKEIKEPPKGKLTPKSAEPLAQVGELEQAGLSTKVVGHLRHNFESILALPVGAERTRRMSMLKRRILEEFEDLTPEGAEEKPGKTVLIDTLGKPEGVKKEGNKKLPEKKQEEPKRLEPPKEDRKLAEPKPVAQLPEGAKPLLLPAPQPGPEPRQELKVTDYEEDGLPSLPGEHTQSLPEMSDKELDRRLAEAEVEEKEKEKENIKRGLLKSEGVQLLNLGKYADAEVNFRKVLDLNPKDISTWINYATALRSQRKDKEAIAAYRKVLELDPENSIAKDGLDRLVERTKKGEEKKSEDPRYKTWSAQAGQYTAKKTVELVDLAKRALAFLEEQGIDDRSFEIIREQNKDDLAKIDSLHAGKALDLAQLMCRQVYQVILKKMFGKYEVNAETLKPVGITPDMSRVTALPILLDYYEKHPEHTAPEGEKEEPPKPVVDVKKTEEKKLKEAPKPQAADPDNLYGIPDADFKRAKAVIAELVDDKTVNHYKEIVYREGKIGLPGIASSEDWVRGVQESKYLNPEQKKKVLNDGIVNVLILLPERLNGIAKKERGLGLSREYHSLASVITNISFAFAKNFPELLESHREKIFDFFKTMEQLYQDGKMEKYPQEFFKQDRARIMEFLKIRDNAPPNPLAPVGGEKKAGSGTVHELPKPPEKPVDRFKEMGVEELKSIDPAKLSYDDVLAYRQRVLDLRYSDPYGLKDDPILKEKGFAANDSVIKQFSIAHIKQKYGATEHYKLLAKYIEAIRPFDDLYYNENWKYGPLSVTNAIENLLTYSNFLDINRFRKAHERFIKIFGTTIKDPEQFLVEFSKRFSELDYGDVNN
ncbi:MAG: hypothetical protein PHH82_03110 [Candidatus ainarchaeum sp.]|nr:hypothetical protein [Candidatus ainarchaeum sp.]